MRRALTSAGRPMNSGRHERNPAMTPDTCGAAALVPLCSAYVSALVTPRPVSPALVRTSPVAAEQIHSPGATTSGFGRPSRVGPLDEVQETPKTWGASRCVEPTVMQEAAWPGSVTEARTPTDCLADCGDRVC